MTARANAISPSAFACKATRARSNSSELVFGFIAANEQMDVHYARVRKRRRHHRHRGSRRRERNDRVDRARRSRLHGTQGKTHHRSLARPGRLSNTKSPRAWSAPLAPGEFWFEHNFLESTIVLDERLEINVPQGRVNQSAIVPSFALPKPTHENGRTIYQLETALISRSPQDEAAKKQSEAGASKPPDVQLTTFANWEEVARWYAELEKGRTEPSPEIRAKTQDLIQGRTTELEKIQALYDYVSKNIRYVSLSFGARRYQPHSAVGSFHESIRRLQR